MLGTPASGPDEKRIDGLMERGSCGLSINPSIHFPIRVNPCPSVVKPFF